MTLYTPAVRDLPAATNADLLELCQLQLADGTLFDMTGGSLAMQVRDKPGGSLLLSLTSSAATSNGSRLTVTDEPSGSFKLDLKKADLAALNFGDNTALAAFYDIIFTNGSGTATVLARGRFTITKGVTV